MTEEEKAQGRYDTLKRFMTTGALELSETEKKFVDDYEAKMFQKKSSLVMQSSLGMNSSMSKKKKAV